MPFLAFPSKCGIYKEKKNPILFLYRHLQHFYLRRWSKVAISSSSENDQHFHRLAWAPLNRAARKRRLSMGDFVKAGAAEGSLYPAAVQGE